MSDLPSGGTVHHFPERELIELAYIGALDAMSASEKYEVMTRLESADSATRRGFYAVVRDVRETMAIASDATLTTAPIELRSRILGAIDVTTQDEAAPTVLATRSRTPRFRILVAAAAAVVVVGIGGAVVVGQVTGGPGTTAVQAADQRTVTVDVTGGGTATVSYSRMNDSADVKFDGIAPPPDGSVYELWLVNGVSRSVGLLDTGGSSSHSIDGMGAATTFAVTVEPAGGSELPTSAPVAQALLQA